MINITVFGSGSSGNCYLITDGESQLILDAGVNFKKVVSPWLNFDYSKVAGLFITHEHGDHSRYIHQFIDLTTAPVIMSQGTADALDLTNYRIQLAKPNQFYQLGTWSFSSFHVEHDAEEPVGYIIENKLGERLLYITDSYYVKYKFRHVNYLMLEMNYAVDLLAQNTNSNIVNSKVAKRDYVSHMEEQTALEFIRVNKSPELQEVMLIHLSKTNADPQRFKKEVQKLTGVPVMVAGC